MFNHAELLALLTEIFFHLNYLILFFSVFYLCTWTTMKTAHSFYSKVCLVSKEVIAI